MEQELKLPTEKSQPRTSLEDYSMLWYGREKLGKTSLISQFPDVLCFFFEPGGKALSVYSVYPKDWIEFKKYVKLLSKSKRFRTVAIDTADIAYQMCYKYVCAKFGMEHPKEDARTVWPSIRQEFSEQMALIQNIGRGVIFTSHETEKEIKVRAGENVTRIVPTMPKQAREVLEPMIDIWGYFRFSNNGEREIMIRGNDLISAGHRLQSNFVGIKSIPMGLSAKEAYANFMSAFQQTKEGSRTSALPGKIRIKVK